jgi:hypothetical protein
MILGQAAGVSAALAIKNNQDVQEISIESLQTKLQAQAAVFSLHSPAQHKQP